MSATVHEILVHSFSVIKFALLPIGQLTEEAQEFRKNDLKLYRKHHSQKFLRVTTNIDLLHRFLILSNLLI